MLPVWNLNIAWLKYHKLIYNFFRPVQYRTIHTTCISPTNEVSTKTFFTWEVVMTYPLLSIMFGLIRWADLKKIIKLQVVIDTGSVSLAYHWQFDQNNLKRTIATKQDWTEIQQKSALRDKLNKFEKKIWSIYMIFL